MNTAVLGAAPSYPTPSSKDDFILVTGGLGYIGSHTVLELMKTGYNVVIVDNLANSFASVRWRIQSLAAQHCESLGLPTPKLILHELSYQSPAMRLLLEQYVREDEPELLAADIKDSNLLPGSSDDLNQRSRITGVIHFAAYKCVEESISDPLSYYDNNVCGLVGLIRLLGEFDIRNFVFSSSATVYGSKANAGRPMEEDDVIHHPTSEAIVSTPEDCEKPGNDNVPAKEPGVEGLTCPYARTKYFCEAILADVARSDPRWRIVALRYFNPTGCDPSGLLGESSRIPPKNLFPVIAEVLAGQRPALAVFGSDWPTRDGTPIRDYVHVVDVARGHIAAIGSGSGSNDKTFRVYNLGSGTGISVLEIIDSVSTAARRSVPVEWSPRRPGDVASCIASTVKAAEELGWFPRESIVQSARDWWNALEKMQRIPKAEESNVIEGH
ncbi:UDP-glucose 4-epimerase [Thozetella sp. PMI_491]|nr:UDP-glucose 4-epimerase [Thozetella sp. PMI_491]